MVLKFERNKNYENGEFLIERIDFNVVSVVDDFKIWLVDEDYYRGDNDLFFFFILFLLLEDDEILGFLVYDMLNEEIKWLFLISGFEKM